MAYASEWIALAALEVLVGVQRSGVLDAYALISAELDAERVQAWPIDPLPVNWRDSPPPSETQAIGDRWVREARSLALRVPSVIVASESNFLINPAHPRFSSVRIGQPARIAFDTRLTPDRPE